MKKFAGLLMMVFMLGNNDGSIAQPIAKSQATTYKNPLQVVFGDPYVLYVKGE